MLIPDWKLKNKPVPYGVRAGTHRLAISAEGKQELVKIDADADDERKAPQRNTILNSAQLSDTEALLAGMFKSENTNRRLFESFFNCSSLEGDLRTICMNLAVLMVIQRELLNDCLDERIFLKAVEHLLPQKKIWLKQDCVKKFEGSTTTSIPFKTVRSYAEVLADSMNVELATNLLVDDVLPATGEEGKAVADKIRQESREHPASQNLIFNHMETRRRSNELTKQTFATRVAFEWFVLDYDRRDSSSRCMAPLLSIRATVLSALETYTDHVWELSGMQEYCHDETMQFGEDTILHRIELRAKELTAEKAEPILKRIVQATPGHGHPLKTGVTDVVQKEVLPILREANDGATAVQDALLADLNRLAKVDEILSLSRGNRARDRAIKDCRDAYDKHNDVAKTFNIVVEELKAAAQDFDCIKCLLLANEADEVVHELFEVAETLKRVISWARDDISAQVAKVKVQN